MKTEFCPPYHARKSHDFWYVVNAKGDSVLTCMSQELAIGFADDLNLQEEALYLSPEQFAKFITSNLTNRSNKGRIMKHISDNRLICILETLGFTSDRVAWAVEILSGRIDIADIRLKKQDVIQKACPITESQIHEAAMYAAMERAMENLRDEMRKENA